MDLKDHDRRNIWIVAWITLGLILGGIIGGIAFVIGEQEFQTSVVGMAIGPSTASQGAFNFDYINIEEDTDRTMDYSTWHPDHHFSNYANDKMDKYEWDIDPDTSTYGIPNVQVNVLGEYYPTDTSGNQITDFVVVPKTLPFYDADGNEWEVTFYKTNIGTQFTITVHGGSDIKSWSGIGDDDWVGQDSVAELAGNYECNENDNHDQSFLGNGADFRIVLRNQIKEFKVGEDTHSSPYSDSKNAFLKAQISSVITNIEPTGGWQYEGDFTGSLLSGLTIMYPTCEDALLGNTQLPDKEVDEIQFYDTLYDTVYLAFEYDVKLGADWNVKGIMGDWALYNSAENGVKIQGWQILVNVFFAITTAYSQPVDLLDNTQYITITNPFTDLDITDPKFNFFDWLKDAWQTPLGRGLIIAGIIIVVGVIGFLFIKFLLPFLLQVRATRKAAGK